MLFYRKKRNQRCKENQLSTRIERDKIRSTLIESCHKFIINTGCSVFLKILDTDSDMAFVYSTDNMYNLYINNGLTQNKSCQETREVIEEAIVHVLSNSYSRSVKVEKESMNKGSNSFTNLHNGPKIDDISKQNTCTTNICTTDQDMDTVPVPDSVQSRNVVHVSTNQNVPNTSNHSNIVNNAGVDIPVCNTKQDHASNIVVPVSLKRNINWNLPHDVSLKDVPMHSLLAESALTDFRYRPQHEMSLHNADVMLNSESDTTDIMHNYRSGKKDTLHNSGNGKTDIMHIYRCGKKDTMHNSGCDKTDMNTSESGKTDMNTSGSGKTDMNTSGSGRTDIMHHLGSGNTDIMHHSGSGKTDMLPNSDSVKRYTMHYSERGTNDILHNARNGTTCIMQTAKSGKTDIMPNSESDKIGNKDYFTRIMYNEELGTIAMHNLSKCDSSDKNIQLQDFFKQKIYTRPFEEETGAENEKNNHYHSLHSIQSSSTSLGNEDLDMCIKTEPEETQEMIYQLAEAAIESVNANFQPLPEFSDSLKIENTARRKRG